MFDPTVFENLKIVLEGAVYDRDLEGQILVINRVNNIELSTMSRRYEITFTLRNDIPSARIRLHASVEDLANELIKGQVQESCSLDIFFDHAITGGVEEECQLIAHYIKDVWGDRPKVNQKISYLIGDNDRVITNEIHLDFRRKINEDQIKDLETIVDYSIETLERLNEKKMPK
jgi:hypothetical protein